MLNLSFKPVELQIMKSLICNQCNVKYATAAEHNMSKVSIWFDLAKNAPLTLMFGKSLLMALFSEGHIIETSF